MQLPKRDRIIGGYVCQECISVWSGIPLPFTYFNGKWMCPDCFQKYQKGDNMFYTKRKEVIFEVESFEVENKEPILKDGIVKFIYNEEDDGFTINTNDIQKIIFNFTRIKTKVEPYYVNNFIINMNEKIIYTYNRDTFKLIKLGEMKEFESFQEAINILENFMEEISIKE